MNLKSMLIATFTMVAFAFWPVDQAAACDSKNDAEKSNIMKSRIALPDDQKLNIASLGTITAVAIDDCAGFVYQANFDRLLKEAQAGNVDAQDLVGLMFAHGAGTKQSWPEALVWLKKAAGQGSANASYRLGVIAQYGLADAIDLKAAQVHYRKSSEMGQAFASTNLGVMYLNGLGVDADPKFAFDYFKLAAQQGDAVAYGNLGVMYLQGLGVEKNATEAIRMFRSGAEMGNPVAMRMLSHSLGSNARSEGNLDGIKEALMWALLGAKAGDPIAQKLAEQAKSALPVDQMALIQTRADRCESSKYKDCG